MPGCVMTMAFGWVPTHRDGLIIVVPYTCIFTGAVLLGGYFRHAGQLQRDRSWPRETGCQPGSWASAGRGCPTHLSYHHLSSVGGLWCLYYDLDCLPKTPLYSIKNIHTTKYLFSCLWTSFYAVNRCPSYICFVVLGIRLQQKDSSWKN